MRPLEIGMSELSNGSFRPQNSRLQTGSKREIAIDIGNPEFGFSLLCCLRRKCQCLL